MNRYQKLPAEPLGEDGRLERWDEPEIRVALETLGTLDWEWFEFGKDKTARSEELTKLPRLPEEVRSQIGYSTDSQDSIALVDACY